MNELKFNSAVCTSIEQSQRLLELGLKPETADMSIITTPIDCDGIKYSLTPYSKINHPKVFGAIPAWSLHRLIELYSDVEDTSYLCIKNISYKLLIFCIEKAIHCGFFNKEYLKQ